MEADSDARGRQRQPALLRALVQRVAPPGAVVLDYGCGSGTVVEMLRAAGSTRTVSTSAGRAPRPLRHRGERARARGLLRYYEEGGRLPFDDDTFDVVVSDQVFEHVVPLEASVREIERVLRPGGVAYHHFPSRRGVAEGHIGIPLPIACRPGAPAWRTPRRCGGRPRQVQGRAPGPRWAIEKLEWIDRWTIYRARGEIHAIFGRGPRARHSRDRVLPLPGRRPPEAAAVLSWPVSKRPAEALFRRLAFEAIETRLR